jgi:fatty acid desaturase/membrane-associated phospholipid phosphatase
MQLTNLKFNVLLKPWGIWFIYMVITALLYKQASTFPLISPYKIEPSYIDLNIPFLPGLAYIYVSYFLLIPVLIYLARSYKGFTIVFITGMVCGLINVLIYLLFPTMLASQPLAPKGSLLAIIQSIDTTLCAIPSGHVALPTSISVAALIVQKSIENKLWKCITLVYAIWAIIIGISALFIGQHYFIDILAGLLLGYFIANGVHLFSHVYKKTLVALAFEWSVVVGVLIIAIHLDSIVIYILSAIIIATRQHALLMLFHDGVHWLVSKNKRLNDLIINIFIGVPLLVPIHAYRVIHLSHHKHLGTIKDPERMLLYWGQPWNYSPLKTSRFLFQIIGDVTGVNSLVMMIRYCLIKRKIKQFSSRYNNDFLLVTLIFWVVIIAALYLWWDNAISILLLWFVPYLTITQLLQKLRSFAEHSLDSQNSFTNDWRPGILGRITIWPYNINYHREHHNHPSIPWDQLPKYGNASNLLQGKEFIRYIWKI